MSTERVSFAQAYEMAEETYARWREAGLDVRRGDRVAWRPQRDDALPTLVALWAALEWGVPLILIPEAWTESETRQALRRAGVRLWCAGGTVECFAPRVRATGRFVVVFTSGSGGAPKPARLSHRALSMAAHAFVERYGLGPGDRWALDLPLGHIAGVSIATRCLAARAAVCLGSSEEATHRSMVTTQLRRALQAAERPAPALRFLMLGGGPIEPSLHTRARREGWPVRATYGMTETCAQVCTQDFEDPPDTVGRVETPVRVRLNAEGRIQIAGPTLFDGWLDHSISPMHGGWYSTPDRGAFDSAGRLRILGRLDRIVITGGENVDPHEIEVALRELAGVQDALVLGAYDPEWGQRLEALVVTEDPFNLGSIRARLAQLSPFKRPHRFHQVPAIPRLSSGKPDRYRARNLMRSKSDESADDVAPEERIEPSHIE